MVTKKIDAEMFNSAFEKIEDMSFIEKIDEKIMMISEMTPSEAIKFIDLESLELLISRCRTLAENDTLHDLEQVKRKIVEVLSTSKHFSPNFVGVF